MANRTLTDNEWYIPNYEFPKGCRKPTPPVIFPCPDCGLNMRPLTYNDSTHNLAGHECPECKHLYGPYDEPPYSIGCQDEGCEDCAFKDEGQAVWRCNGCARKCESKQEGGGYIHCYDKNFKKVKK